MKISHWYMMAALTPALMALVTIATKGALQQISKEWFLVLMFVASIPFLTPWTRLNLKVNMKGPWNRGHTAFVVHAICIGVAWLFYSAGIARLPASIAVFISRFEGMIIILLAVYILKETFERYLIGSAVLALAGVLVIDWFGAQDSSMEYSRFGVLLVLGGCVSFAIGEIFARKALDTFEPRHFTLLRNLFLVPLFGLLIWISGQGIPEALSGETVLWILVAALSGPVGARVLYLHCIKHIPVSHAAVMTNTEPVFGAVFGMLFFSEFPNTFQYVGAALIAGAVLFAIWRRDHAKTT